MITQARLKELLDYDPATGIFRWKVTWNGKSSGKTAGKQVGRIAGSKDRDGYVLIRVDGKRYRAARLAVLWMEGEFPPDDVDHWDGSVSNDAWGNLRKATTTQNLQNKRIQSNNKVGLKGVFKHKLNDGTWRGQYRSRIKVRGKHVHLGLFDCPAAAYLAYIVGADTYYGEFARA